MVKLVTISFFALILVGCGSQPVKLKTEVQYVNRPILYCPAPNWQELDRPDLAIEGITSDMSPGDVAKRYKATVKQLMDHARRLETTLRRYDKTSEAYDELREQFLSENPDSSLLEESLIE